MKDAEEQGVTQIHKSHIDYYVANGIKSRIALVQNRWKDALDAAQIALEKPDLKLAGTSDLTKGSISWEWYLYFGEQKYKKVTR